MGINKANKLLGIMINHFVLYLLLALFFKKQLCDFTSNLLPLSGIHIKRIH